MSIPTSWGYYGIDWTSPATLATAPLPLVLKTLAYAYDERFNTAYGPLHADGAAIRLSTLIPQPVPVPGVASQAFVPPDFFDESNNFVGALSSDPNHVYFTQTKLLELLGVEARIPRPTSAQAISAEWLHETYRVLNLLRYRRATATQTNLQKSAIAAYSSHSGSLSATRTAVLAALASETWATYTGGGTVLAPQQLMSYSNEYITVDGRKRRFSAVSVAIASGVPGFLLYYKQTELAGTGSGDYTQIFDPGSFSLTLSAPDRWLNESVADKDSFASSYEIYPGEDFTVGSAATTIPDPDAVVDYGWGTADRSDNTQRQLLVFDATFAFRTW